MISDTDLGSLIGQNVGNLTKISPTQILREINFGHFKTAILTIWAGLNS